MILIRCTLVCFISWLAIPQIAAETHSYSIGKFPQESAEKITSIAGNAAVDSKGVFVDAGGKLHLRTADQHFVMDAAGAWQVASLTDYPEANQVLFLSDGQLLLATDNGVKKWSAGTSGPAGLDGYKVNGISRSSDGRFAAATDKGLFESKDGITWDQAEVYDAGGRQWAVRDVRSVTYDHQDQL